MEKNKEKMISSFVGRLTRMDEMNLAELGVKDETSVEPQRQCFGYQ